MYRFAYRMAVFAMLLFNVLTAQENSFKYSLIPDELKVNCNAIVQYQDMDVVINSQTKLTYTVRRAVTVLNEKGNRNSLIGVGYDKDSKVLQIRGVVYDEEGNEIQKIKKKDFYDVSNSGVNLYTDNRALYYKYSPISYPYTIVHEYEVSSNSTGFIPSWNPIQAYMTSVIKVLIKLPQTRIKKFV